ncbi:MAG: thiamine diphosphokinase [Eubacterium sp.]|nr:thiamine diphosphokinase [Eubacterium sp.]
MNCLLVGGGAVDSELLEKTFKDLGNPYTFGVDRGCIYLLENNLPISKAVGDFDSLSEEEKIIIDRFFDEEQLNPIKDDTDTEHALKMAISMKPDKIMILGCTGTRLDQTFASIRLLKLAADEGIEAFLLDKNNRIRVVKGISILSKNDSYGRYISILPFGETISGLKIRGFKYDATDLTIDAASSLGVSNELTHDAGIISCDDYYILMETHD